jgi:hypothetical protein
LGHVTEKKRLAWKKVRFETSGTWFRNVPNLGGESDPSQIQPPLSSRGRSKNCPLCHTTVSVWRKGRPINFPSGISLGICDGLISVRIHYLWFMTCLVQTWGISPIRVNSHWEMLVLIHGVVV